MILQHWKSLVEGLPMLKNHVLSPQAAVPHYLTLLLCECPQAGGQKLDRRRSRRMQCYRVLCLPMPLGENLVRKSPGAKPSLGSSATGVPRGLTRALRKKRTRRDKSSRHHCLICPMQVVEGSDGLWRPLTRERLITGRADNHPFQMNGVGWFRLGRDGEALLQLRLS